jgi:hypothetical protein
MTKWAKSLVETMNIFAAFLGCIACLFCVLAFAEESFSPLTNMPLLAFIALLTLAVSLVFWATVLGVLVDISESLKGGNTDEAKLSPASDGLDY